VVGALPDQVLGGADPEGEAAGLGLAVGDLGKRRGIALAQVGLGVWRVGHQDLVGGRHRRRLGGGATRRVGVEPVGLVAALDSEMTAGSSVTPVRAVAAPAVPVARRTVAVMAASQLESCAFRRLIEVEEPWMNARTSHPCAARSAWSKAVTPTA
jgi:hypothetical protein